MNIFVNDGIGRVADGVIRRFDQISLDDANSNKATFTSNLDFEDDERAVPGEKDRALLQYADPEIGDDI